MKAKAAAAPEAARPKRKMPDLAGVPGEVLPAESVPATVRWGSRLRQSPYDGLLQQLREDPRQALRFGDARAHVALAHRAKKLGIPVEFGWEGATLWVRFAGVAGDKGEARRAAIRGLLKPGVPWLSMKLAAALRERGDANADEPLVRAILNQMAASGELVRQDGGTYVLHPRGK